MAALPGARVQAGPRDDPGVHGARDHIAGRRGRGDGRLVLDAPVMGICLGARRSCRRRHRDLEPAGEPHLPGRCARPSHGGRRGSPRASHGGDHRRRDAVVLVSFALALSRPRRAPSASAGGPLASSAVRNGSSGAGRSRGVPRASCGSGPGTRTPAPALARHHSGNSRRPPDSVRPLLLVCLRVVGVPASGVLQCRAFAAWALVRINSAPCR